MGKVHFIDTSVLVELLNIPNMNTRYTQAKMEYEQLAKNGDTSIVEQFNDYWEHQQPIGEMRIWAFDQHLMGYSYSGGLARRKNK